MKKSLLGATMALALVAAAPAAMAQSLVINMTGWQTVGGFNAAGNSEFFFTLPEGSVVNDYSFSGLVLTANAPSYLEEFVISVNDSPTGSGFMDMTVSAAANPGTAGPLSGSFSGAAAAGLLSGGAPFTVGAGANNLYVTVYELFVDDGITNAVVGSGTLTINYTAPIPEPATYGLMALGLLGVAAAARRRRQA